MRIIKKLLLKIITNSFFNETSLYLIGFASKFVLFTFNHSKKSELRLAKNIADLLNKLKAGHGDFPVYEPFDYWAKRGFYIIPNHFYQPIPDITTLNSKVFKREAPLHGINMNEKQQLELLNNKFSKFKEEFKKMPVTGKSNTHQFHLNNLAFDGIDAFVYYSMIKIFEPKNIVEVGSGWSTKIAAKAALQLENCKLYSIEPYPQELLKKGFPGFTQLLAKKVEDIPVTFFEKLNKNDILFIDSSHTVKVDGDVNYLIFSILPKLKKGVIVHIHDIFLPLDYPEQWVKKEHRFWSEQYLLQAFLMFNDSFVVLYGHAYMGTKYPKNVRKVFPMWPHTTGGSFWIRKK